MKLQQMRALVAISETGSFQSAARTLSVTQPALSKTIHELEEELGVELLRRGTRGVTLTEFGRTLLVHCKGLLEGVKRARQDIEQMKGATSAQVNVAVTSVTGIMASFASCIAALRKDLPEVRLRILELRPNELIERIREGVVDFGITSQDVPQEGEFECIKLCERESRIAVRRGHPAANLQSLDAIRQLPWITLDPSGDMNAPFRTLFAQSGLALPQQITECSSMLLAMHLALLSDSALLLSEESFKADSIKSEFVELDYRGQIPLRPIFLLHRPEFAMSSAARRLFGLVKVHFVV